MRNVAKINLEINRCVECPYCYKPDGYTEYYCRHDLKRLGVELGDGESVPDFCPFVIERLQNVLKTIDDCSYTSIPKKYLMQIEKRQRDDPNPKFGADHSWLHARNVTQIGLKFLEDCSRFGYSSPDTIQKEKLLFQIAAYMHDIGLAESARNHAIHSSELAKKYLSGPKIDIDVEDAYTIVHAIFNHSDGEDTRNIVDAALILADKLDVTGRRIIRVTDNITAAVRHIVNVQYDFYGNGKTVKGAKLRYATDGGFDVSAIKMWPKCITVPMAITKDYLGLSEFRFLIDDEEIDIKSILG